MIPASDAFIKAMTNSIKEMFIKLEFFDSNMTYIEEFTKKVTKGDIGAISVDSSRPIRRSFSFSLVNDDGYFTWGDTNKLIWIDKRVKLYIGLKLSTGEIEYVPQGLFIMSEPQDSHGFDGVKVSITGQDKAFLMTDKRGKFINTMTIAVGTNIGTAIKLMAQRVGETMFNFDTITETVPYELTYQPEDNIYKAIEELAMLGKCQVYYDVHGYLRLRKIDLNEFDSLPAVWAYKYGDKFEKLYSGNVRKMDETDMANYIRVLGGSSQTAEVMYDLIVTNTNPLWVDSPYVIEKIGQVSYFHNGGSPDGLLTTVDDCKFRAKYELMKRLGYTERVSLSIAPNFLHDVTDVIQIEDNKNGVTGKYLMQSFQIPLNPSLMICECSKYRKIVTDWNFI